MEYKAGALVRARDRDWIILPSNNPDLVLLKPLGGSDDEITGIYLPLKFTDDKMESTEFPLPTAADLGDISSARLLFNAARLSFRSGAGPFRSLAKLSFRPRSYQMVPLIMALKQQGAVRLLIADDVGVGKTVEALLILRELIDRGEIKRFAIIVLPHLCEQWQEELRDKFGIEAVIIRSNTQARLDRQIPDDRSVFDYYPYQIISIDYIKTENRKAVFVQECPELIIVDEAHTCSKSSVTSSIQQQRYSLINDISRKKDQNIILLTATPHSGKSEQFNSLLSLIKAEYATLDIPSASQEKRRDLAKYYVQRRRADVEKWMGEDTPFPERDSGEAHYELSKKYAVLFEKLLDFSFGLVKTDDSHKGIIRLRYWSALALLRGVMSSPAAGIKMLENRKKNEDVNIRDDVNYTDEPNPMIESSLEESGDYEPSGILSRAELTKYENQRLNDFVIELKELQNIKDDFKAQRAFGIVKDWLKQGFQPIIFCKYIRTANYLGELFKEEFKTNKKVNIQVVTGEDHDEIRKARIDEMKTAKKQEKILIATDCISEGINLQDQFNAVLHYDLPWNPNRLEQREGRIDRYGQKAKLVKAYLMYGSNNPIDGVVLKVLLRKVREIRRQTGISIPFPEDSQSMMDSILQAVLSKAEKIKRGNAAQMTFDFGEMDEVKQAEGNFTNEIEEAAAREKASRNIFAQNAIKADTIEEDLKQSDEAIGKPEDVEAFVTETLLSLLGVQISKDKDINGYTLFTVNLPPVLKPIFSDTPELKISFFSPTPEGYIYIGRNHKFVEQLCLLLMANAINRRSDSDPARTAVIKSKNVEIKTTLLLFRVRNVIEEKRFGKQLVAEEMLIWGYQGSNGDKKVLEHQVVKDLMINAVATANITKEARIDFLENELKYIENLKNEFNDTAKKRAEVLIAAHERFREVLGGKKYQAVEPVLPMDLIGIYILLPDKGSS
ncbi:MAG: DEAD/DEAH box helicase [Candidatus Omnitrophica bacterium]|nr:DEAD/DEAH box helicase [Candidatus Omnitrophota bacterium]